MNRMMILQRNTLSWGSQKEDMPRKPIKNGLRISKLDGGKSRTGSRMRCMKRLDIGVGLVQHFQPKFEVL